MLLDLVDFLVGAAVAVDSTYLLVLGVAALRESAEVRPSRLRPQRATGAGQGRPRLVVLVPAYNEVDYIGRCVESLLVQDYPATRYSVVVIADNCTDATAEIAAGAGAEVFVRLAPDARGKGQALRWAMDQLMARVPPVDAIVVVDADSAADPGLLSGLVSRFDAGADAVQGDYQVLVEHASVKSDLQTIAFLLFHQVRFGGRAKLGLPCNLVGNGMLFSRQLLERMPWNAFTSAEDLEYSVNLRLAGIAPVFAPNARVLGPMPTEATGQQAQRRRWVGGRMYVVRTQFPVIVRAMLVKGNWSLADAAIDLATPPLGVLSAVAASGFAVASALALTRVTARWPLLPWSLAVVAIPAFVVSGMRAAKCPPAMYRSLASAPRLVASQLCGYIPLVRHQRPTSWERSPRPSESGGRP